ncbi:MAG: hypothetical protein PHQ43_14710 [Dehalococcoidales bacterium]|nr:hypothetical protein [Dehalococcoidales bacterium]
MPGINGMQWYMPVLLLGIGFVGLGIYLLVKASRDEESYFSFLSTRPDVRRYLERSSLLAFISLKVGGRVSLAVGVGLVCLSAVLWYWGY